MSLDRIRHCHRSDPMTKTKDIPPKPESYILHAIVFEKDLERSTCCVFEPKLGKRWRFHSASIHSDYPGQHFDVGTVVNVFCRDDGDGPDNPYTIFIQPTAHSKPIVETTVLAKIALSGREELAEWLEMRSEPEDHRFLGPRGEVDGCWSIRRWTSSQREAVRIALFEMIMRGWSIEQSWKNLLGWSRGLGVWGACQAAGAMLNGAKGDVRREEAMLSLCEGWVRGTVSTEEAQSAFGSNRSAAVAISAMLSSAAPGPGVHTLVSMWNETQSPEDLRLILAESISTGLDALEERFRL